MEKCATLGERYIEAAVGMVHKTIHAVVSYILHTSRICACIYLVRDRRVDRQVGRAFIRRYVDVILFKRAEEDCDYFFSCFFDIL